MLFDVLKTAVNTTLRSRIFAVNLCNVMERVQRRFSRMIPELKALSYTERLSRLNLWSLEERRVRADLLEVYKIVHGLSAIPFEDLFELDNSGRTRGHSLN